MQGSFAVAVRSRLNFEFWVGPTEGGRAVKFLNFRSAGQ
jgi:hypothetical protein